MQYSISPNTIVINVYAANVEDIRIVDLPGWIGNKNNGSSPSSDDDNNNNNKYFGKSLRGDSDDFSDLKGGVIIHSNLGSGKHDASGDEEK